jgi:hypothetical protein
LWSLKWNTIWPEQVMLVPYTHVFIDMTCESALYYWTRLFQTLAMPK